MKAITIATKRAEVVEKALQRNSFGGTRKDLGGARRSTQFGFGIQLGPRCKDFPKESLWWERQRPKDGVILTHCVPNQLILVVRRWTRL